MLFQQPLSSPLSFNPQPMAKTTSYCINNLEQVYKLKNKNEYTGQSESQVIHSDLQAKDALGF